MFKKLIANTKENRIRKRKLKQKVRLQLLKRDVEKRMKDTTVTVNFIIKGANNGH